MALRILFITTTNLASNPRLLKELRLANKHGFHSTVIQFTLGNWSDIITNELKKGFQNVLFIDLSATRKPFFQWISSSMISKLLNLFSAKILKNLFLSVAINKRSLLLFKKLKTIHSRYDWVIAHNPGAFYPAADFAKFTNSRLGIDVEDFHPGETNNLGTQTKLKKLMSQTLPKSNYCSFASPLIEIYTRDLFPYLKSNHLIIINAFEREEFLLPLAKNDLNPLQLVWFSQNIDEGRGLEIFIPMINQFSDKINLHLIGKLSSTFNEKYLKNKNGIIVHPPMSQLDLHRFLSNCDIGLAIDMPNNLNRELALTNKIVAYVQAGLFILATPTKAHQLFLYDFDSGYRTTDYSSSSILTCLNQLIKEKAIIRADQPGRFHNGRNYDWELFSDKLLDVWLQ